MFSIVDPYRDAAKPQGCKPSGPAPRLGGVRALFGVNGQLTQRRHMASGGGRERRRHQVAPVQPHRAGPVLPQTGRRSVCACDADPVPCHRSVELAHRTISSTSRGGLRLTPRLARAAMSSASGIRALSRSPSWTSAAPTIRWKSRRYSLLLLLAPWQVACRGASREPAASDPGQRYRSRCQLTSFRRRSHVSRSWVVRATSIWSWSGSPRRTTSASPSPTVSGRSCCRTGRGSWGCKSLASGSPSWSSCPWRVRTLGHNSVSLGGHGHVPRWCV